MKDKRKKPKSAKPAPPRPATDRETRPDWKRTCFVCGDVPTLPITGLCGPCTFGEAETIGGNW